MMNLTKSALMITLLTGTLHFPVRGVAPPVGWHGIVPLHSNRKEVEKMLGSPSEELPRNSVLYRTKDEAVIVFYSKGSGW
jgi:hypothetical protein